ncbi:MAG: methyltransferase [Polyangia bacterium]
MTAPRWQETAVAVDRSHHLGYDGALYSTRFDEVLKFHAPGLAAVRSGDQAWHIDVSGRPAYAHRFRRTFGFYEGLAAVHGEDGWRHIKPDGTDLVGSRHAWCGNFQSGRSPVRSAGGEYFHIDATGQPAYAERWRYAGDYRDGSAVVQREDGLSTHVDLAGHLLHGRWYLDLDVFHKGHARARDERGWLHVDERGFALYARRFAQVEPFYNGQARVETSDGGLEVIDEQGQTLITLRPPRRSRQAQLAADISAFFRPQTLRTAVELGILDELPGSTAELAARTDLPEPHAQRLLRGLWELDLVAPGDQWRLTDKGELLTRGSPSALREAVGVFAGEYYQRWQYLAHALRSLPAQGRSAQAHFAALSGEPLRRHLQMQDAYAKADYAQLPRVLDWCGHRQILDAGGGLGTLLRTLLAAHPHLRGVLLELPAVAAQVEIPVHLSERMTVRSGDLFAPWAQQADAVILARVLHDWPDDAAKEILLRAREALAPQGRLYILDRVLPADLPMYGLLDLHMLLITGGRERSQQDWQALLRAAGLSLQETHPLCAAASILICSPTAELQQANSAEVK